MDLRLLNAGTSVDRAQTYTCNLGNVSVNSLDARSLASQSVDTGAVNADDYSSGTTPKLSLPRSILSQKAFPAGGELSSTNNSFKLESAAEVNYLPLPAFVVGQIIEFHASGKVETNDGQKDYVVSPWFQLNNPPNTASMPANLFLQSVEGAGATQWQFTSTITIIAVTPTTISFSWTASQFRNWLEPGSANPVLQKQFDIQSDVALNVPYVSNLGKNPFMTIAFCIADGGIANGKFVGVEVMVSYVRLLAGPSGYVPPTP